MEQKLELRDVAGYFPYELKFYFKEEPHFTEIVGCSDDGFIYKERDYFWIPNISNDIAKPILRPLSGLYRTIVHNGEEIIPIVELAKIYIDRDWIFYKSFCLSGFYEFGYDDGFFVYFKNEPKHLDNQYQLFDYLHELKIDYRRLIDEGLAIDCNTLENNPYK